MWFPLATPLKACGLVVRFHFSTSALLRSSLAGAISQQRHGSAPQFPSNFVTVTLAGSGVRMNVSKSAPGPQPDVSTLPDARRSTDASDKDLRVILAARVAADRHRVCRRPEASARSAVPSLDL